MIRGVPYDAEVEYLESTGTQWIDTGVYYPSIARYTANIRFRPLDFITSSNSIWGIGNGGARGWGMCFTNFKGRGLVFAQGSGDNTLYTYKTAIQDYDASSTYAGIWLDGDFYSKPRNTVSRNGNVFLFATN